MNSATPVTDQTLLTKEQVADRLGVRPRTVAVWVQQDRLRAYHLGRLLRFKWEQVEEFLANECQAPAPAARSQGGKLK